MSLQIWLPLIEDLHNQGLSNLTFHNIGNVDTYISQSTDGKLGKCYINNAVNGGGIVSNETINLNGPQSMFCWVNFSSLSSSGDVLGAGITGNHDTDEKSNISLTIIKPSNTETTKGTVGISVGYQTGRNYGKYYGNTVLNADTWYHIGFTYSGTTNNVVTFYVNGQQDKIVTLDETPYFKANYFEAFAWSTASSNRKLNGKINDVRIYNHCLSAKEVEEISKGLVVHYMLSPQNLINKNIMTLNKYIKSDGTVGDSSNWCISDYIPVTPGQVYNAVGFASGGNSVPCIVTYSSSQVKKRNFNIAPNENYTITIAEDEFYIRLSVRTTNNEIDTAGFYLLNGTIYDCSGYANNATVYTGNSTTLLAPNSPSPRYDKATQFNNSPIKTDNIIIPSNNNSNIFSIAAWVKLGATNRMWFGVGQTKYRIWFWLATYFGLGRADGTNNNYFYSLNNINTTIKLSDIGIQINEWHHYCIVNTGSIFYLYVDGNKVGQSNNNADQNYLKIKGYTCYIGGAWNTDSNYNFQENDGMSDFRLYTTALTESQVRELYNTSMTIDANGNIFARGLVEE